MNLLLQLALEARALEINAHGDETVCAAVTVTQTAGNFSMTVHGTVEEAREVFAANVVNVTMFTEGQLLAVLDRRALRARRS